MVCHVGKSLKQFSVQNTLAYLLSAARLKEKRFNRQAAVLKGGNFCERYYDWKWSML